MKRYTQTNLDPGDCWQTAVACILEVEPEKLPPQAETEALRAKKFIGGWGAYKNVLNGYLAKHHGLLYFEVQRFMFPGLRPTGPYHVICGPTIRTPKTGVDHVVVGRNGVPLWDPHPSRLGLTRSRSWGLLGDVIDENDPEERERKAKLAAEDRGYGLVFGCLCPECGLDELRRLAESEP